VGKLWVKYKACITQGEALGDLSCSFLILNISEAMHCIKKLLNFSVLNSDSMWNLAEKKRSLWWINLLMIMNMHVYSEVSWHYLVMATLKLLPQITS